MRAGVVSAGEEDSSFGQDHRRGDRGDADLPVGGVPEDRAVVGRNAGHAALAAIDEHPLAGELHRHDRRMGHRPAARIGAFPNHLAGLDNPAPPAARRRRGPGWPDRRRSAGTARRTTAAPWRRTAAPGRSANRALPVAGSRHETWHFGPRATTYLSVTAGTVRDMPWFRFTATG